MSFICNNYITFIHNIHNISCGILVTLLLKVTKVALIDFVRIRISIIYRYKIKVL